MSKIENLEAGYRPAVQKRSIELERRLLAAAETLFAEHGYSGTTVADLLKLAKCSTGSFYHRVGDKEGLFRRVTENYLEFAQGLIDGIPLERTETRSLPQLFEAVADASFENIRKNKGFYRAARELIHSDPSIWNSINELNFRMARRLDEVVDDYRDQITVEDAPAALRAACQLILSIVLASGSGRAPLLPKDEDGFRTLLVNAAMGIVCPFNLQGHA